MDYWEGFRQPAFYDHEQLTTVLSGIHRSIADPNIFTSLSNRFCRSPELDLWFERHASLPKHDPAHMAANWKSMRLLHIRPPNDFCERTWRINDFSNLNTREVTELLYAPARVGMTMPRDFVARILSRVGTTIDDFTPKYLTRICWSIGFLTAATGSKEFGPVFDILAERAKKIIWHPSDHNVLSTISPLFDHEFNTHVEGYNDNKVSKWENSLRTEFNKHGFVNASEELHYSFRLARNLDLRFMRKGKDFIIEADGPHHFAYDYDFNEMCFNGSTVVQTAVMQKLYPDAVILRLNYKHFHTTLYEDREERQQKIVGQLSRIFNYCSPDAYQSCLDGENIALRPFFGNGDDITLPTKEKNSLAFFARIQAAIQSLCLY